MKPHHKAWLDSHPHRTEEWLMERLKDGFDVHHIDGVSDNHDPKNLVLIEHGDHMALHNGGTIVLRALRYAGPHKPRKRRRRFASVAAVDRALKVYEKSRQEAIDLATDA